LISEALGADSHPAHLKVLWQSEKARVCAGKYRLLPTVASRKSGSASRMRADGFQFSGLGMVGGGVLQRQLFFALFAHFVVAPFFNLIVISIAWSPSLYYQKKRMSTSKCVFFMQFIELFPWMDTNYIK
jgi:hypothetical protein